MAMKKRSLNRRGFLGLAGAVGGGALISQRGASAAQQGQPRSGNPEGSYREPARDIPVLADYDVVVCGGGAAGCAAALASARHGARTLLVEKEGYLGGTTVMALVNVILSTNGVDFQGVWHEWARTLLDMGGIARMSRAKTAYTAVGAWLRGSVDPEMVKYAWDRLLTHDGVDFLFHAHLAGAIAESGAIRGVLVETVAGRRAIYAGRVVDCTGDAAVCAAAGVPWEQGYAGHPLGMAVDLIGFKSSGKESRLLDGDGGSGSVGNRPERRTGQRALDVDALDPWALSAATVSLRRKLWAGGQQVGKPYTTLTASRLGVRSTRRVQGIATVTADDAWAFRKYPDGIARSSWELDIHPPSDQPIPVSLKNQNNDYVAWQKRLGAGDYFDIRYGCLVARGVDHLLVAGRCISADYVAQASLRIQQTCQATGQAAGTAAALSLKGGVAPRELDARKLVGQLERDRAAVEPSFELLKNLPLAPRS